MSYGTLIDSRDNQTYKSIEIENQIWMAENMNYASNESFCYDSERYNCLTYGRLYTWNSAKSACPGGWHLPSVDEWNTLIENVGGAETAGKNLRSTNLWARNPGVDSYGFSILPAGTRDEKGNSRNLLVQATFWSIDKSNSSTL